MSMCAVCAAMTDDGADLCDVHDQISGDDWATGNRDWCDFLHRRRVPLPAREEHPAELMLVAACTELDQPY